MSLSRPEGGSAQPFRYRLQGGRVLVHDRLHAATTALIGEDRLAFIYFDYDEDFSSFSRNGALARQAAEREPAAIDGRADRTDLIHFSSLPWVSFTSISHARNWKREDSVPKITFGKYQRQGDRTTIPISVEVHHALMDGLHVSLFLEQLQSSFLDPEGQLINGGVCQRFDDSAPDSDLPN